MATVHWSLGYFKEHGHTVTAYCEQHGQEPRCRHSAQVDIDKAIEKFGADFIIPNDYRRFVGSLRCANCGSKEISIQIGNGAKASTTWTPPVWLRQGS